MKSFKILLEPESIEDIQDAIAWYNKQKKGLGSDFYTVLKEEIERLRLNPFFQLRYNNVRCLPLRKYPFMIHFTIDEDQKIVIIRAVFNTSIDPRKWKGRE